MRSGLLVRALLGAVAMVGMAAAPAAAQAVRETGPEGNFCAELQSLPPGGELALRPGEYRGPCKIRRGGAPGAPIVLRAADPGRRPRIGYPGRASNVIEVRASHVVIRGLEFSTTLADVDAIRIFGGTDITVEDCRFTDIGGISVVANHNSVQGLTVRGNEILSSNTTAMYFGCHDGRWCMISDLVVELNYIRRVTAPETAIGYGVQLKLNTTGVIRDNVIIDTKGPGIMVYGAADPRRVSVVERNFVMGSHTSAGIVVGGGPAVVWNNIAQDNAGGGVALQDYGKRGLLRGVIVSHNTLYRNGGRGIVLPDQVLDAIVANNAVVSRDGTGALPVGPAGVVLRGNVDCTFGGCFVRPDAGDFSPVSGSALGAGGPRESGSWVPREDFSGAPRGAHPIAGALERGAAPVPAGTKR